MRTSVRVTGAVATLAATALLVSGCGSSDDSGGGDKPDATPTAEKSSKPPGKGGGNSGPGTLPGVWQTKVSGKPFVLTIVADAVTLLRDKKSCTGRVSDSGQPTLMLTCPGGTGEERTNGVVDTLQGKTLKVKWNGGATDTYTKVADAPKTLPKDPKDLEKLLPKG